MTCRTNLRRAAGLALSIGNPKVMLFYLALRPTILDLARVTVLGYVELVAVTLAVLSIVLGGYIALAARARLFFTSPRAMNAVNRGSAGLMAGAATWLAVR
jgi:threonine/homoserine/homoserine lactone efflux protein